MKEARQSTLTAVEATHPRRPASEQLRKSTLQSDAPGGSSTDEIQTRTSTIVLLFLDLAKVTGDAAYLDVATAGAKHLAKAWNGLSARAPVIESPDELSSGRSLSRAALALAETWKATKNPLYQHAGLNIIRYLTKAAPATGRQSDPVHLGGRR
jgi:uncharacterized protein YyaL (SSP411 family)